LCSNQRSITGETSTHYTTDVVELYKDVVELYKDVVELYKDVVEV